MSKSDIEIIKQTNELAKRFYYEIHNNYVEHGFRFDSKRANEKEREMWALAVISQYEIKNINVYFILLNIKTHVDLYAPVELK